MGAADGDSGWLDSSPEWSWWHSAMKKVLTAGAVPRHVAFIMDGNRRYARSHLCSSVTEGHHKGFDQLTKVLGWCRELGIVEVTVFAFSIENFKRSEEEVNGLMELFEKKLIKLSQERKKLEEKGIAIRFFGDLSYLSPKLRKLAAEIEISTSEYKPACINLCIAYTSQNEICRAFTYIHRGIRKGLLEEEDINEHLISQCLDSRRSADPDLLIRTSGEKRLSDFLLFQCSNCYIHFDDALWPEFGFWNLCKAIFGFQFNYSRIQKINDVCAEKVDEASEKKAAEFIRWVEADRFEQLRKMAELQID